MNNARKLWRTLFFSLLLAALCGSFALPVTSVPVSAAPQIQTGTADLSLTMVVNNAAPNKADPVVFTITVTNLGPDVATSVTVEDVLPAGLTYVSDSGAGTYNSGTGIWIVGNVGINNSVTLNITVNATTIGTKTNTAQILSSDQTDTNPGNNTASKAVTPKVADVSLVINGIPPASSVSIGDLVTFTVRASNAGPDKATGVKVLDLLPAGLTYVSHTSTGSYTVSTGNWNVGDLNANAFKELTITATVTSSGTITNSAEVTESDQLDPDSTPANGNSSPEDDYAKFTLNSLTANLSLTLSVNNATPNKADNVVFTITVINSGPNNATGVTVKDLLPAGLTYLSDDGGGTYNKNTGIWSVGSLVASGSGATDTLHITVHATTTGMKTNVAEVWTSNQADPNSTPGNGVVSEDDYGRVSVTPNAADLSITKTVNNAASNPGDTVQFTITVKNGGPDTASGVTVQDLIPSGYSYQSDNSNGDYNNATGIWSVGSLTNGASATLKINVIVQNSGQKINKVEILTSDQLDPDSTPGNNSTAEDDDDSVPKVDLSLTKTANKANVAKGSSVTFTLTLQNDGPAVATGVTVKDVIPTGLSYVSDTGGSSYDKVTGIWTVGNLAVGATKTLNITATGPSYGTYINAAEIWTCDQFDVDSTPGNGSTTEDDDEAVTVKVVYARMTILINEVAWAGTAASTSDEWIELYNPGSTPINLSGWVLKAVDGTPNIPLSNLTLAAGGYYLLERTDDTTVSDIAADQIFSGDVGNSSETLRLYDPLNHIVDTANSNGSLWPAGSATTYGTMERRGVVVDSDTAWTTNTGKVHWGLDANGKALLGTPKHANWAISVTATPSLVPTPTRTPYVFRTSTPGPQPPPQLVAINEFVPRPDHDWNQDGAVNVGDEFIEILNHGTVNVNLSGYSLDDEANTGSDPYRLPSVTVKPGERVVFYGSETGLLLSDGGDGVRLLKPNGQLMDAYNYSVVRYPDESYCRLPDNGGLDDWNQYCYPTPGLQNSLRGGAGQQVGEANVPSCPISDTLPDDFVRAECDPFGNNIWRRAFWDATGWLGEKILPDIQSRWDVFAD